LPSAVFSLARGTAISIGPNVPVRDRVRLPWRWPLGADRASLEDQSRTGETAAAAATSDGRGPVLIHTATYLGITYGPSGSDRLNDRRVVVLPLVDPRRDRPHPHRSGGERSHQVSRIRLITQPKDARPLVNRPASFPGARVKPFHGASDER